MSEDVKFALMLVALVAAFAHIIILIYVTIPSLVWNLLALATVAYLLVGIFLIVSLLSNVE